MSDDPPPTDPTGLLIPELPLSRALIEGGGLEEMIARHAPALRLLTEEERAQSLRDTLAARPQGDVWVFAYGSLIWNPTFHSVERRTACIEGWHRDFCLAAIAGRGSVERPGLMLGLKPGGACVGVALRIEEAEIEQELTLLWRREMVAAAYLPHWVRLFDERGVVFGHAIAFTIDTEGPHYASGLSREAVVERLATAAGPLGTAAEYLFRTRDGLRSLGIRDDALEALADEVGRRIAARGDTTA